MKTLDISRDQSISDLFKNQPKYRHEQLMAGLFDPKINSFSDISNIPKQIRDQLEEQVSWMSFEKANVLKSRNSKTEKAMITLNDGNQVETVLMGSDNGRWTICVSSQVGCAMKCGFCATGQMGLKRNLTSEEIIDQFRFWQQRLGGERISNVVFMGMGEPLANYENVKTAINTWLKYTDIGQTHITVSTVGHLTKLQKILTDPDWPHVRLAISLHSADVDTRKEIVPTSSDEFLDKLAEWAKEYLSKFGNRKHHLTFEYVMLKDVNDTDMHAKKLIKYVNQVGKVKVNLIPYNLTDNQYKRSEDSAITKFKEKIEAAGIVCTVRKTMGEDIAAACGQLIKLGEKRLA